MVLSKMKDIHSGARANSHEEPDNVTCFQGFEWYVPADHKHWCRLQKALPDLRKIGIDNIWIPPGCKGGSAGSNGYDIYDLYDLGEFDQKGTRATKWGTREELADLMEAARANGIGIYWDTILNHKSAADYAETCQAVKVDPLGTPPSQSARHPTDNDRQEDRLGRSS